MRQESNGNAVAAASLTMIEVLHPDVGAGGVEQGRLFGSANDLQNAYTHAKLATVRTMSCPNL